MKDIKSVKDIDREPAQDIDREPVIDTNGESVNDTKKKKTAVHDGLLILVLLLAALAVWRFAGTGRTGGGNQTANGQENGGPDSGAVAHVQMQGREDEYYPLSKDGVYALNDGTNTLVIENGEAWMSDADCPDKLCVHQGKIHKNGQWIICLPNRVAVTIEGAEEDAEWDEILG